MPAKNESKNDEPKVIKAEVTSTSEGPEQRRAGSLKEALAEMSEDNAAAAEDVEDAEAERRAAEQEETDKGRAESVKAAEKLAPGEASPPPEPPPAS